jgi:hypothetical protein
VKAMCTAGSTLASVNSKNEPEVAAWGLILSVRQIAYMGGCSAMVWVVNTGRAMKAVWVLVRA